MLMTGAVETNSCRLENIVVEINATKRGMFLKSVLFFAQSQVQVPYSPRGFSVNVDLAASCLAWSLTISSWLSHPYVIIGCI
jgi:hypothetical protein